MINSGTGTFAAAVNYAAGSIPFSVAIGDVNGDGKADLAVANYGSNTVSVLINSGTGTFATPVNYATGLGPVAAAIGDVNGDGKADLAVANFDGNTVSVLINSCAAAAAPTITTTAASSITSTTASSGGNVTADGGSAVTARGVAYGTTTDPTTAGTKTSDGTGTGTYTSSLTGLTPNTTYYYRAYATNSVGTSYGAEMTFTTSAPPAAATTTTLTSSPNPTCFGSDVTFTANVVANGTPVTTGTVTFTEKTTVLAADVAVNASGQAIFTTSALSAGSHTIVATYNPGSGYLTSMVSVVQVVNQIPGQPTVTAGGPTTFCTGGSVTLTSSAVSGNQWYTDGAPINGATNQSYPTNTAGNYTVIVTSNGCSSAASTGTQVTVNPIPPTPTVTANGPTTFCTGGSVTLTSNSAAGNQWYLNGNLIGSATNQTYVATASGNYTVIVTSNGCSSVASASTQVTVNPKPTITCPENITINNTPGLCSAVYTYLSPATGTPAPTISYTFSGATTGSGLDNNGSGKTFNVGITTVKLTATNTCGSISCTFIVTVKDVQPPVINQIAKPIVLLWSPNHSYQTITESQFITSVTDNCGNLAVANVVITKVTSDELEDAPGDDDGNTINDIVIAANCKSVQLRSERMGSGNGRVYTIYVSVKDNSGNTGTATFKVLVAKSQNGTTAVDNITPLYTVNSSCGSNSSATAARQAPVIAEEILQPAIQTFPNPFSTVTTIRYALATDANVSLAVYNNLGQKVAQLVNGRQAAGTHQVIFNAANHGAGMYHYNLQTMDDSGKATMLSGKMVRSK